MSIFYIVAVATNNWVDFDVSIASLEFGLWESKSCDKVTNQCLTVDTPDDDDDINAVRAFGILAILFSIPAFILRFIGASSNSRVMAIAAYGAFTIAWFCMLIATGVFSDKVAEIPDGIDAVDWYGYSFALAVSGWVLSFVFCVVGVFADVRNIK